MKDIILTELANKWKKEALEAAKTNLDGADAAKLHNAEQAGVIKGKRNCAEDLIDLIKLLGDD